MKIAIRNRRWNYFTGAMLVFGGAMRLFSEHAQDGTLLYFQIASGVFLVLINAVPYAWIEPDRLVIRRLMFPKSILFKDIVRIESDPVRYYSQRKIILHEASGLTTELLPPDSNKFLSLLSAQLPESVSGRSTGNAPPPWDGRANRPFAYYVPPSEWSIFGWMSLVYDAKTHTIHPPSDGNAA